MIPILGGTFAGPLLRGIVLPEGADRQLVHKDCARKLEAHFELQTDDGAVITVADHMMLNFTDAKAPYAFSTMDIVAPEGRYGWLNDRVFVGTLHTIADEPAVRIRIYAMT